MAYEIIKLLEQIIKLAYSTIIPQQNFILKVYKAFIPLLIYGKGRDEFQFKQRIIQIGATSFARFKGSMREVTVKKKLRI